MTGEEQELLDGINTYALDQGWQEKIPNENYDPEDPESPLEIDNPESIMEFANRMFWNHISNSIISYNKKLGEKAGGEQAEQLTKQRLDDIQYNTTI